MKKLILIFTVIALFASCKTVKNNIRETYTEHKEIKTDIKEETSVSENTVTTEKTTIEEYTEIEETITNIKLSEPDSLGNQHPIEVTTTDRKTVKGKKEQTNKQAEIQLEVQDSKIDNSTENTNIQAEKIDKTVVKKTTPGWMYAVAIIFSAGILIIVFVFLKKYRIL